MKLLAKWAGLAVVVPEMPRVGPDTSQLNRTR